MSFFFLLASVLTLAISHWWARRTRPQAPKNFEWLKSFQGSRQEFEQKLKILMNHNPQLMILEKAKNHYLISEAASLLSFGQFYHIELEEKDAIVEVKISVQPKLVASHSSSRMEPALLKELDKDDVG